MTVPAQRTPVVNSPGEQTWVTSPGGRRRLEIWHARSVDGIWDYQREEGVPGTPWHAVHRPTGYRMICASLRQARFWTGRPDVLDVIRRNAQQMIDVGGDPYREIEHSTGRMLEIARERAQDKVAVARQTLAILDGLLMPARSGSLDAVCNCGGLVAFSDGQWRHVNGCHSCWSAPKGWIHEACAYPTRHMWCDEPYPAECDHDFCTGLSTLGAPPCERVNDRCCGCCADA